ncbi:MAG: hypothetical protein LBU11_12390 [Zoogloeaceae bacterium]|jgi:hypothetical protein|nr:hypothetical protein [Zoogloeaceae bacterium]
MYYANDPLVSLLLARGEIAPDEVGGEIVDFEAVKYDGLTEVDDLVEGGASLTREEIRAAADRLRAKFRH